MGLKSGLKEAAPFAAMVVVEWGEVGMVTLAKAALNTGISTFVYLVYYNSLGVVLLFPLFIFRTYRKKQHPLTLALLFRFFLLGLFGRGFLMFGYIGLKYSSPALAASLANLVPVFTFLIAIIFRMEKIDMKSPSSLAKSLGTVVAVFGAFVVTLYKGPPIISGTFHSSLHSQALVPQNSNWALGGLLLTIGFFSAAIWIILQAETVKQYPEKVTVVFFFMLFGTMQCAFISSIVERTPSSWTLRPGIAMIAIIYSAIFGVVLRFNLVTWCLHEKGPLFVALFKPLGMVIAVIAGLVFLDDTLHLGSVIGAAIIAIGFYTVMWGQAKERKTWSQATLVDENLRTKI
ncbi:WAT1-related protein At3g28050-like [Actinidia eriantha]|uniref:WAT1-related protein At3g28050-like n=1 Tax=Actinidia eriantha TaxID=165200 RepID=UPI0025844370|nr:WAT1-related protein At3g28050-like [Actinidia eriantha]